MEKCWICKRTKDEIENELAQIEKADAQQKQKLNEAIHFIRAEESDYPNVHYCSVCDSLLADFILKEGVITEEDEDSS